MSSPVNGFLDQRVLERVRAEYLEMPGMRLTRAQIQRLCGIDQAMCTAVLDSLVNTSFLSLQSDGTYVRPTEGGASASRSAKAALHARTSAPGRRRAR